VINLSRNHHQKLLFLCQDERAELSALRSRDRYAFLELQATHQVGGFIAGPRDGLGLSVQRDPDGVFRMLARELDWLRFAILGQPVTIKLRRVTGTRVYYLIDAPSAVRIWRAELDKHKEAAAV
jgi:hypothetical protein